MSGEEQDKKPGPELPREPVPETGPAKKRKKEEEFFIQEEKKKPEKLKEKIKQPEPGKK